MNNTTKITTIAVAVILYVFVWGAAVAHTTHACPGQPGDSGYEWCRSELMVSGMWWPLSLPYHVGAYHLGGGS